MLMEEVKYLADEAYTKGKNNKNLILHIYLKLLEESIMAGNIFMCRYRTLSLNSSINENIKSSI